MPGPRDTHSSVPLRGGARRGGGRPVEEVVRVLLVEGHAVFRKLFASAFDRQSGFEVVAEADSMAAN